MEFYIFAVVLLILLAISDLIVGVSNDAVNFLNSSIGSRVAPIKVIMIIASLGMLAGVTFSSGMMEVARKGIFHPEFFTMSEIMVIFLAVMLTDILLLDLYNTFGLPTSTTVSIVFELLGGAVAVSLIMICRHGDSYASLAKYINTSKALAIISGILLSVVIAFIAGAVIQFITRMIFTFEYKQRLRRYGALWGGIALSMITYFILIKGAKGASFMTDETIEWIKTNSLLIMGACFLFSAVILQFLLLFTKVNILKPIVLIGTFALAMAFAANDLVNFIGVPLAGLSSYNAAQAGAEPLTMTMEALKQPVKSNTGYLLIAGVIMAVTLWVSKKARTVTKTEVSLGSQYEEVERFGSSPLSRSIVRMTTYLFDTFRFIVPDGWQRRISARLNPDNCSDDYSHKKGNSSFDLLRASVNLMVASAVVSFATSMKLPLSTTYVTFMVAMGTSLSDQAWGRDSAVYRVSGVLAVIGGWFLTALIAFTVSFGFAFAIYYFGIVAVLGILGLALFLIWRNHHLHKTRAQESKETEIFNLRKITDADKSIKTTFEHGSIFLAKVDINIDTCFKGLFNERRNLLKGVKKEAQKLQTWSNIITANIFKTLRLLSKEDQLSTQKYARIINALQNITDSHRDIILRAYTHINNNHKGLLEEQIRELEQLLGYLKDFLVKTSELLLKRESVNYQAIRDDYERMNELVRDFDRKQISRIQDDVSKTRLSILFYGMVRDFQKIAGNTLELLEVFNESFKIKLDGKEHDEN